MDRQKRWGLWLKRAVPAAVLMYAATTILVFGRGYSPKNDMSGESFSFLTRLREVSSNQLSSDHSSKSLLSLRDASEVRGSESAAELRKVSAENIITSVVEDDTSVQQRVISVQNEKACAVRVQLYHSFEIFEMNYVEMLSKLKIFIYPSREQNVDSFFKTVPVQTEDLRTTDEVFHDSLFDSNFVTMDPEKADMFFLPISIRSLSEDSSVGPRRIGRFLAKYIQNLRKDYPYWQRTLGADHIVVVCNDYKEDGSRNGLELKKNVIQVVCSPLAGNGSQDFFPYKDFALPPYTKLAHVAVSDLKSRDHRITLAYYAASDTSTLNALNVSWNTDPDFVIESRNQESADYFHHLATSQFCVIVRSDDKLYIVDALKFGCVPVIVSDGRLYDLPFQDVLNWNQFTVVVSLKNIGRVKDILKGLSNSEYKNMQIRAREASKHLEWHSPPQPRDAFFMALYDLWLRRHAIRYTRRTVARR